MVRLLKSALVVVLCLVSATLVLLFSWLPKGGIYPWVSQRLWGPGLLWLAGASLEVRGRENLRHHKHCIYYANHQSYYDIPALCAAVSEPLYFIAKRELLKIPIFGWGMYAIGMVFVDRTNPERARASIERAAVAIHGGKSILAFPEGTRSEDGALRPFKKGIFHVALKAKIPMVPVAIFGTQEVLSKDGKLYSGHIRVVIGAPIEAAFVQTATHNTLAEEAHRRLNELMVQQNRPALHIADLGGAS